jgi:uncharacterized ubiquitin-like protein YukD
MYHLIQQFKQCKADFYHYPFGQYLHIATPNQEEADKIYDFVEQMGYEKKDLKLTQPTIEDCFIQLMNRNKISMKNGS